jgi:hypothetical protein
MNMIRTSSIHFSIITGQTRVRVEPKEFRTLTANCADYNTHR